MAEKSTPTAAAAPKPVPASVAPVPPMPQVIANAKMHRFTPQPLKRVPAGVGVAGTAVEAPAFLKVSDEQAALTKAASQVGQGLMSVYTDLRARLPQVNQALQELEASANGQAVAQVHGVDLAAARRFVDGLTELLKAVA